MIDKFCRKHDFWYDPNYSCLYCNKDKTEKQELISEFLADLNTIEEYKYSWKQVDELIKKWENILDD